MKRALVIAAVLFLVGIFDANGIQAQEVKVLVLDALSGKPEAGAEVQYLCAGTRENYGQSAPVVTNADGYVQVKITCSDKDKVELWVLPREPKEECGELSPLSLNEILSSGVLADPTSNGNIWCPKKASKKLKAIPGQIILFVKKPTWIQSHF